FSLTNQRPCDVVKIHRIESHPGLRGGLANRINKRGIQHMGRQGLLRASHATPSLGHWSADEAATNGDDCNTKSLPFCLEAAVQQREEAAARREEAVTQTQAGVRLRQAVLDRREAMLDGLKAKLAQREEGVSNSPAARLARATLEQKSATLSFGAQTSKRPQKIWRNGYHASGGSLINTERPITQGSASPSFL
ncbi:hypothetical protein KEM56_007376, partial [Ascosphaera pollenicola]